MKKEILKADIVLLTLFFGYGLVASLLSVYLNSIGVSLSNIGLIFAGGLIMGGILRIPFGVMVDNFGRKKFIIIGTIGFPIYAFLLLFASEVVHFVGAYLLLEIFAALFWTAFSAYFLDLMDRGSEGKSMALRNVLLFTNGALTPFVAGALSDLFGFKILFIIGGSISMLALPLSVLFLKPSKSAKHKKTIVQEYSHILKLKGFGIIFWLAVIINGLFTLWAIYMPIYLANLGYSFTVIGAVISAYLAVTAVLQIPLGKAIDNFPAKYMIVPGFFIAWVFGLFFLAATDLFTLTLSRIAVSFGKDMTYWPAIGALSRLAPKTEHGGAWAFVMFGQAIIQGVVALGGGILVQQFGIRAVLWFVSWLALAIGLGFAPSAILKKTGFTNKKYHLHRKQHAQQDKT